MYISYIYIYILFVHLWWFSFSPWSTWRKPNASNMCLSQGIATYCKCLQMDGFPRNTTFNMYVYSPQANPTNFTPTQQYSTHSTSRCPFWPMAISSVDIKSMNSGSIVMQKAVGLRELWLPEAGQPTRPMMPMSQQVFFPKKHRIRHLQNTQSSNIVTGFNRLLSKKDGQWAKQVDYRAVSPGLVPSLWKKDTHWWLTHSWLRCLSPSIQGPYGIPASSAPSHPALILGLGHGEKAAVMGCWCRYVCWGERLLDSLTHRIRVTGIFIYLHERLTFMVHVGTVNIPHWRVSYIRVALAVRPWKMIVGRRSFPFGWLLVGGGCEPKS